MSTVVVLSIGVAIAVALPIAWRVRQGRFDPFEPILVFALAWGVHVRRTADRDRRSRRHESSTASTSGTRSTRPCCSGSSAPSAFVVGYATSLGKRAAARVRRRATGTPTSAALVVVGGRRGRRAGRARTRDPAGGRARRRRDVPRRQERGARTRSSRARRSTSGTARSWWCRRRSSRLPSPSRAGGVGESRWRSSCGRSRCSASSRRATRAFLIVLVGGFVVFVFLRMARRPGILAICLALAVCALRVARGARVARPRDASRRPDGLAEYRLGARSRALAALPGARRRDGARAGRGADGDSRSARIPIRRGDGRGSRAPPSAEGALGREAAAARHGSDRGGLARCRRDRGVQPGVHPGDVVLLGLRRLRRLRGNGSPRGARPRALGVLPPLPTRVSRRS